MKRDTPESSTTMQRSAAQEIERLREHQERLFSELEQGRTRFRQLARSVWRVQEEERRRLARELHDGIGQNLTALAHQLQTLKTMSAAGSDCAARFDAALALCASTVADTRAMSRLLRPQILDDLGLGPALQWLVRSACADTPIQFEVDLDALPETLDGEASTLLFRVAQEAVNNALRHAAPTRLRVQAASGGKRLLLSIQDDGCGFNLQAAAAAASTASASGLAGMRERVALFGGELQLRSTPGRGTHVQVNLPLQGYGDDGR